MRVVVALGGNALLQRGEEPAESIQRHHVVDAVVQLSQLAHDNDLIITHGNGPQVGLLAVESASDPALTKPYPLDVIGAQTQGMIGYWLLQALTNALPGRKVVSLVTESLVDADDPAFSHPAKFVGLGYEETEARRLAALNDWSIARDGERWRRVVASPDPRAVLGLASVEVLVREGVIVVCAGGGGIPVTRTPDGSYEGIEAVIDKDLATAVIARDLHADVMLILTDVEGVMRDYATPRQQLITKATPRELRARDFAAGSMGPKVDAACRFVEKTGMRAVIGLLDESLGLLDGSSGTTVIAN